jgi:hypothetical protein
MKTVIVFFAFWAAAGILCGEETAYDSHGKRNPFIPPLKLIQRAGGPEAEDVDIAPLKQWFSQALGGILWDEETPYVLIGDKIIGVGDQVRGCTIVAISQESVVFDHKGKRVEVPLREEKKEKDKDEY